MYFFFFCFKLEEITFTRPCYKKQDGQIWFNLYHHLQCSMVVCLTVLKKWFLTKSNMRRFILLLKLGYPCIPRASNLKVLGFKICAYLCKVYSLWSFKIIFKLNFTSISRCVKCTTACLDSSTARILHFSRWPNVMRACQP